jgi:cobalt-precorrin-6B (C15)-methyltransferase
MNERFKNVEMIQVGISRGEGIGGLTMLKAANPIFIISGDV